MRRRFVLGLMAAVLWASPLLALTDEEIFRDFRFNLINPGARSLALGGAFISLADDATAAQANPAGLSYLRKAEYFIELRAVDNAGREDQIQETLPGDLNTVVETGTNLDDYLSISFASIILPIKRFTFGFSRQVVLNTSNTTLNSFSLTRGTPDTASTQGTGSIEVNQVNYNVSAGLRLNDRFAIGASIAIGQLRVRSDVVNIVMDPSGVLTEGQVLILEPTLDIGTHIDGSDSGVGFSLGAIYRPSQKRIGLGAVYRKAPKFSVTETIEPGLDLFEVVQHLGGNSFQNQFNIPDSYGVGAFWQPSQTLTFALDIERVEYSDLARNVVAGVNQLTDFDAEFTADDATEFRLGGEYVQLRKGGGPVAYRGGVYTQSDNTLHAVSTGTASFATPDAFPGRDRELHYAAGLGLGLGSIELDLGMDLAHSNNQFLVSFIYKSSK